MDKSKLLSGKKYGDVKTVAEIMNVTRENAQRILSRPNSKRHDEAVAILNGIIEARKQVAIQAQQFKPAGPVDNSPKAIINRNIETISSKSAGLSAGDMLTLENVDFVIKKTTAASIFLCRPGRGNHTLFKVTL